MHINCFTIQGLGIEGIQYLSTLEPKDPDQGQN